MQHSWLWDKRHCRIQKRSIRLISRTGRRLLPKQKTTAVVHITWYRPWLSFQTFHAGLEHFYISHGFLCSFQHIYQNPHFIFVAVAKYFICFFSKYKFWFQHCVTQKLIHRHMEQVCNSNKRCKADTWISCFNIADMLRGDAYFISNTLLRNACPYPCDLYPFPNGLKI